MWTVSVSECVCCVFIYACLTSREGMNIEGHILLLCVSNIKKVSSDWSLRGISTEVQHHHTNYSQYDANWLAVGAITNG